MCIRDSFIPRYVIDSGDSRNDSIKKLSSTSFIDVCELPVIFSHADKNPHNIIMVKIFFELIIYHNLSNMSFQML